MGKRIGEQTFNEVKEMTEYCKSIDFVAKKCGVSTATVSRIKSAKDYKDFSEWSKRSKEARVNKLKTQQKTNQTQPTAPMDYAQFKALAQDVDKIKTTLDLILVGITELVECWKGEK